MHRIYKADINVYKEGLQITFIKENKTYEHAGSNF